MKKEKNNKTKEKVDEYKFSKKQLMSSEQFKNYKDILSVVINDNEELSLKETKERIEKFMKGKVN